MKAHITNWNIFENRICGEYKGKSIMTSEIKNIQRIENMQICTTTSGSIYFIYDDKN